MPTHPRIFRPHKFHKRCFLHYCGCRSGMFHTPRGTNLERCRRYRIRIVYVPDWKPGCRYMLLNKLRRNCYHWKRFRRHMAYMSRQSHYGDIRHYRKCCSLTNYPKMRSYNRNYTSVFVLWCRSVWILSVDCCLNTRDTSKVGRNNKNCRFGNSWCHTPNCTHWYRSSASLMAYYMPCIRNP